MKKELTAGCVSCCYNSMAYTAIVKLQVDYFRFKYFYSVLQRKYTTLESFVKQNF